MKASPDCERDCRRIDRSISRLVAAVLLGVFAAWLVWPVLSGAQTLPGGTTTCPGIDNRLIGVGQASMSLTNTPAALPTIPAGTQMAVVVFASSSSAAYRDDGGTIGITPLAWNATPVISGTATSALTVCAGQLQAIRLICTAQCAATTWVNWYK